jgi:hypothetical protein
MQTIIAAHIAGKNVQENYLFIALQNIAIKYKNCKILLFTTENILVTETNIEIQNIGNKNKIAKAYWKNFTLTKILKNATCFITNDKLCSKTNILQYFFIAEDVTKAKPKVISKIKTASSIFVVEAFFKEHLEKFIAKEKIINLSHGIHTNPLEFGFNQTKSMQGDYTNGYDYFLFFVNASSKENIITVLKAFSIVKKWQKTSMKLVLLLDNVDEEILIPNFKNYKHKEDVVFVQENVENKAPIIASAFTCLFLDTYNYINNAFIALQNNVPVIAANSELNKSIFENAILYTNLTDKNIAENMQQLYKDEQLKKKLQIESETVLQKYNAEKAATFLYQIISA